MIFLGQNLEKPKGDVPPTPLDQVSLEEIICKCEAREMAWLDVQTFIGFLAKRIKDLES